MPKPRWLFITFCLAIVVGYTELVWQIAKDFGI